MKIRKSIKIISIILAIIAFKTVMSINEQRTIKKFYASNISTENLECVKYTVKTGDSISVIAERFQTTGNLENLENRILYINNINDVIYPGQVILIPKEV